MPQDERALYIGFWAKKAVKTLALCGWFLDFDQKKSEEIVKEALKNAMENKLKSGLEIFIALQRAEDKKANLPNDKRFIPLEIWPDNE